MTNRLYVSNLPFNTTEDAIRRHFATCGGVAEIELGEGRGKNARGLARVTMTSPSYAAAAVDRLDRVSFEGRLLRVSESPIPVEATKSVKILQQFRERANMTYELDCAGVPLTVRIFPIEGGRWRIEARSTDAGDAVVITAFGATRRDAMGAALQEWNARAAAASGRSIDADGCLGAMSDVRAV